MSQQLINHSEDLRKLRNHGYEVRVSNGYLIIDSIPYVNAERQVKLGQLVSELTLAGDATAKPSTHTVQFGGEEPCDREGVPLSKIINSAKKVIFGGVETNYRFSSKPSVGYADYFHKMTTYIKILWSEALAIDPKVTPMTFKVITDSDDDTPFNYIDTATSRAGLTTLSEKLDRWKIAIIGVGGTGSYVLDQVAKTPVSEIHIFDDDIFSQHNSFRAPGAASIDDLKKHRLKVDHFAEIYGNMHKGIIKHPYRIDEENTQDLEFMDFVFLCIDDGRAKEQIVKCLQHLDIPFVDVGMGLYMAEDGSLAGSLRVVASSNRKKQHIFDKGRIPFTSRDEDAIYAQNIQVADLNMLNAALAVIKWKKAFGFYTDQEGEHFMAYTLAGNHLVNDDSEDDS